MATKGRLKSVSGERGNKIKVNPADNQSTNTKYPVFSFKYLQDKYCISKCEKREKASFADRLRMIGKCPWNEIFLNGRHELGFEKISKKSLRVGIPDCVKEDTEIIAFRYFEMKPMLGFKDKEVFHILWVDRKMKTYKHS